MLKPNTKDLTGLHFSQWEVLKFHDYKNRNAQWVCKCTCGTIKPVSAQYLLNGSSTKCINCARLQSIKKCDMFPNNYWKTLTFNASKRDIIFNITKEQAYELLQKQNYICRLSGVPIYMSKTASEHNNGLTTASIDRIDSNIGYEIDNIQWVHIKVNIMKNKFDQTEFLQLCKLISNFNHDGL